MGFFSNVFHGAENFVSGVFHGVENTVDSVASDIKQVPSVVNNAVNKVTGVANNVVNTTGSAVKGFEWDIFVPFAAIGIGLLFLLRNSSPNTISNVAQSASRSAPLIV